ncbi:MAG TPA: GspH/FimT family pseudopilin [Planctomycetota bacterium]|nr:GspH/FimT family pseudopilin [Planctomycetota bacterium]
MSVRLPSRPRGFTLLELILVMILIFTLAGVVMPRFSDTFPSLQLRTSADRLLSWLRKARAEAALTGVRYRLVLDTKAKKFWLAFEAQPWKDPGRFQTLEGAWTPETLPDSVTLETLEGLDQDPDQADRKVLEFRPDGTSSDATIVLGGAKGEKRTLKVVGATSKVSIEAPPDQP